jgi:hypothetical protein
MSTSSKKAYFAEYQTMRFLQRLTTVELVRPRAGRRDDRGDIVGLPLVISVKNWTTIKLGNWTRELTRMMSATGWPTGIVVHKRIGRGHPRDWYVSTTWELWLTLHRAYLECRTPDLSFLEKSDSIDNLPTWIHELEQLVASEGHYGGVVVHQRRGRARYVTTTGALIWPVLQAYVEVRS